MRERSELYWFGAVEGFTREIWQSSFEDMIAAHVCVMYNGAVWVQDTALTVHQRAQRPDRNQRTSVN